jgi:hypothetical protein
MKGNIKHPIDLSGTISWKIISASLMFNCRNIHNVWWSSNNTSYGSFIGWDSNNEVGEKFFIIIDNA